VARYANCRISDIIKAVMVANNIPIEIFASRGLASLAPPCKSAASSSFFEISSLKTSPIARFSFSSS
jgi:hypothetical protein